MAESDSQTQSQEKAPAGTGLSLDTWAVLAAFLSAFLVRTGVIKHVPW